MATRKMLTAPCYPGYINTPSVAYLGEDMPRPRKDKREGRMIHVRIPENTHKRLRIRVAELDTTMQDWVTAVVERELGLKRKGGGAPKK